MYKTHTHIIHMYKCICINGRKTKHDKLRVPRRRDMCESNAAHGEGAVDRAMSLVGDGCFFLLHPYYSNGLKQRCLHER